MAEIITTSDGAKIDLDSVQQTLNYNVDGTLNYIEVHDGANRYRQTMTYTSGKITGISRWIKQ